MTSWVSFSDKWNAAAVLTRLRMKWAQPWLDGYAGTSEASIIAEDRGATPAEVDALHELAEAQRRDATAHEREWQETVLDVSRARRQLLLAHTVEERRRVADELAQIVQQLVLWDAPGVAS